jgi:hypothetical protein
VSTPLARPNPRQPEVRGGMFLGRRRVSQETLSRELRETGQRIGALRRDIDQLEQSVVASTGGHGANLNDSLQRLRLAAAQDELPVRQQELVELLERETTLASRITAPFSWRGAALRVYRASMALLAIVAVAAIGVALSGLLDLP